jgi:hypothetical protein
MNSEELRAIGRLGGGLLLIGVGVLVYVILDSPPLGLVVGVGNICAGIAAIIYGFNFLFRPSRFKVVGAIFVLLAVTLVSVAVVLILVQAYRESGPP